MLSPTFSTASNANHVYAPDCVAHHDHRVFIGPLPRKALFQTELHEQRRRHGTANWGELRVERNEELNDGRTRVHHHGEEHHPAAVVPGTENDDHAHFVNFFREHALRFFIEKGGRTEDWNEDKEQSTLDAMMENWLNSEWGSIWARKMHRENSGVSARAASVAFNTSTHCQWVGGSFDIGHVLGINLLRKSESLEERVRDQLTRAPIQLAVTTRPNQETTSQITKSPPSPLRVPIAARTTQESISATHSIPAKRSLSDFPKDSVSIFNSVSEAGPSSVAQRSAHEALAAHPKAVPREGGLSPAESNIDKEDIAANSGISHWTTHSSTYNIRSPELPFEKSSTLPTPSGLDRRKHYDGGAGSHSVPDICVVSNEAEETMPPPPRTEPGEVVLRDRMMVRVSYTEIENNYPIFDEAQNRTARDLSFQDFAEFLVVWRLSRLELYDDYVCSSPGWSLENSLTSHRRMLQHLQTIPGKEWMTGHKHLAYVIPLKSPPTRLSLYSFVDMTFCLTCPPTSTRSNGSPSLWRLRRVKEGNNIFVFNLKSRSRAYDWIWKLWQHMGGQLPKSIEVRNPRLDTRVKIDIPSIVTTSLEQVYEVFERDNVIALCMQSLRVVGDWNSVIERELMAGKTLELAWRMEADLDWIWLERDTEENERRWAVLCGLALRQSSNTPYLELRLADHYPDHLYLRNGKRIHQPPSIEGYLDRIKPNTQLKQQVYLTTHDGHLFVLLNTRAHPPAPPGLVSLNTDSKSLRDMEIKRGRRQLKDAIGVCDLRSILLIRRAFQAVPQSTHRETEPTEDDAWFRIWSQQEEKTTEDDEDRGGEEGLSRIGDKSHFRVRRCFELLLKNGRVIRFEAHSRCVAIEWIERLRALVLYWKERQRVDAREEMDLASARRPRLTPQTHVRLPDHEVPPEPPADAAAPMPALSWLYNWCVLKGCRPIIHGGKVYMRQGFRGQYRPVQMFLVAGHIVLFKVEPSSALHRPRNKKISLMDAYVCSGYLAALALPRGQYDANKTTTPRKYQDGLEADDIEEDMLFVIWHLPRSILTEPQHGDITSPPFPKAIPPLSAKRKALLCRTRSRLERNAWCWALGAEIERVIRSHKDREVKLRQSGGLLPA